MPVERGSGEPVARQVEHGLRDAIRSGRLTSGETLPSSRRLAEEIGLSRGVVQRCYEQLVAEGYLTARAGSRTKVAALPSGQDCTQVGVARPALAVPVADLRPCEPDLSSFPRRDWLWAAQQALAALPHSDLGYPHPAGSPTLRRVLASYLRRVRAADTTADQVLVCSGFAQGLRLAVGVLAARGLSDVAVEDPGYGPDEGLDARTVTAAGGRLHRVPVDDQGIDVDQLASTPARVVIVTPAHQSPTGVPLSPQRRRELLDWAQARDGFVLEDDYDSEFRYDRQAIGVLQGMAPRQVVLLGTVSKTLAPALRLGWIVAPDSLGQELLVAKQHADRGTSTLEQESLAVLLSSGRYDRHLRAMRKRYLTRRDLLVDLLSTHLPQARVSGLAAGLNLLVHLPEHVDEAQLVAAAADNGVKLSGLDNYLAVASSTAPALVVGFGNVTEQQLREAIPLLADLIHRAAARSASGR